MADKYGVNAANQSLAVPTPNSFGENGGKVRIVYDEYDASADGASLAATKTLALGKKLPVGCKVVGGFLVNSAGATGGTIKIGDAQDDDRYLAPTSIAAAGYRPLSAIAGIGYAPTEDTTNNDSQVIATIGGATFAGVLKFGLFIIGPQ